jgi:hypothetical protein
MGAGLAGVPRPAGGRLPALLALLAAALVGLVMSFFGHTWWRRLMIAAGFPLAVLALGAAAWPAWSWLRAAGLAGAGVSPACVARCARVPDAGRSPAGPAPAGAAACGGSGAGCRLRARPRPAALRAAYPTGPSGGYRVELAPAPGVCTALPLGAGAPGRHLACRLAALRPGLPVPAAREHAARAGQSRRTDARQAAGSSAWSSRPPARRPPMCCACPMAARSGCTAARWLQAAPALCRTRIACVNAAPGP